MTVVFKVKVDVGAAQLILPEVICTTGGASIFTICGSDNKEVQPLMVTLNIYNPLSAVVAGLKVKLGLFG